MKVSVQKRSKMIADLKRVKPSSEGFHRNSNMNIAGCANAPSSNQALEDLKKYVAYRRTLYQTS